MDSETGKMDPGFGDICPGCHTSAKTGSTGMGPYNPKYFVDERYNNGKEFSGLADVDHNDTTALSPHQEELEQTFSAIPSGP